ncbi:MAG: family 10 glycosylhydrolase [Methylacidiphilales bacterium]|nr:family 10 glycosylhydrolase [Candidatus Methylacidiphilales bacterium]
MATIARYAKGIKLHLSQSRKPWFGIRYRWFVLAVAALLVFTSLWQAPTINRSAIPNNEIRGVWMTNYGAALSYYTTRLDDVIANIAKHRLNTIYPAVWNRGYTLHPSTVAESVSGSSQDSMTSLPLLPFQDTLSELVKQAHRQKLRIIPWFEYGLVVPKNHAIAKRHPDWLTMTQSGKIALKDNMAWLNPCHPEVQEFLTNLIVDVVKRYPVDGIQLDDHFALPVEFGYDAYTAKLYRREHNGNSPPQNPKNSEWMAWRAGKLTQLMDKISKSVKDENQDVIISLSPNSLNFAYNRYLQDWGKWVDLGLLDEVIVQVYREDLRAISNELNNRELQNIKNKLPIAIGLYTGPFLSPKSIPKLQREIQIVQKYNYSGVSFFCWETTLWFFKGGSEQQLENSLRKVFT